MSKIGQKPSQEARGQSHEYLCSMTGDKAFVILRTTSDLNLLQSVISSFMFPQLNKESARLPGCLAKQALVNIHTAAT